MLHWRITKWDLSEEERLVVEFSARNLMRKANENLLEGTYYINKISDQINRYLRDHSAIKDRIDILYSNIETRPYAVLFTYDLFINNPSILEKKYTEEDIIEELELYSYNNEVALFLFHYYAERLNFYKYRMKFHSLLKTNSSLESKESLNALFFNYIAEYYSHRYKDAFDILKDLKKYYPNAIRKDKVFWLEQDSYDERIFEGTIINKDKYYYFKSNETGGELKARIKFEHNQIGKIKFYENVKAKLFFNYNGLNAQIIDNE